MKPIAHGPGPLPRCIPHEAHTFAPSATVCLCLALSRPPMALGEVTLFTPTRPQKEKT